MNPLDLLKTQLQNALNESTESEDFKAAIRSVDRRDNAYGGYRFGKRRVEAN